MANRLIIGQRGVSEYVFMVSKPGVNVLTASDSDLIFKHDWKMLQVVQTGNVVFTKSQPWGTPETLSATLSMPNQGYKPWVYVSPQVSTGVSQPHQYVDSVYAEILSNTSIRIRMTVSWNPVQYSASYFVTSLKVT